MCAAANAAATQNRGMRSARAGAASTSCSPMNTRDTVDSATAISRCSATARFRSGSAFLPYRRCHQHRLHARGIRRLNSKLRVFKHQAMLRSHTELLRGHQKTVRSWFSVFVVFGAHQYIELVHQSQRCERTHNRCPAAARDNRKRNPAMLGLDMLEHIRNSLQLVQLRVIEVFL